MIRARQSKSAPVGVVSKVLRVFEALSSAPEGLALKDIAQRTGINKSTAYRFLAHLEFEGYLYRDYRGRAKEMAETHIKLLRKYLK